MKVGVYLSEMPPEAGGGYTFEREVFDALVRMDRATEHRFHLITPHPVQLPAGADHVSIVEMPAKRRVVERFRNAARKTVRIFSKNGRRELRRARRVSWRERFLLSLDLDMMWYPTPTAATLEIPYITVVWDLQHRLQPWFPEVSANAEWDLREQHYAQVLRRATYIIAGTEVGRREIERFYGVPSERVRILPHPTPEFAWQASDGKDEAVFTRYGIGRPYIFYPAQFWPHKNHVGLLTAVAELERRHGLAVEVVLVGSDKGNRAYIQSAAAALGLSERVRFPGFVSQSELAALYRNALATTYLTYFGPENLPPLEAFAAGCPVVASAVSGSEEQLAGSALLVDPRDAGSIAEAIARIHAEPALREALVAQGRQRAARFRPADFVREVVKMLDEFAPVRACWPSGEAK